MSSLSGEFSYVFIPADEESPIELKQGDKSGGLSDDFLVKSAKEYFHQQSGGDARAEALNTASPEERKKLAQQIRNQVLSGNPNAESQLAKMNDDALIDLVRSTQASPSCEILALTVPTKGNQYKAVSMYAADDARGSGAKWNPRATALMEACGHAPPPGESDSPQPAGVCGDVFVGRCFDKEDTDVWERIDFTVQDASPSADWCAVARSSGGGGGAGTGSKSPASLSGVMAQALQQSGAAPGAAPLAIENNDVFTWNQTDDEVEIKFSVASGTKAKYVKVQFALQSLKVTVAGQTLVQGSTGGKVSVTECTYTIQDEGGQRELCVILGKNEPGVVWPYPVKAT